MQADHNGTVTAVNLDDLKGLTFGGHDLAAIKAELDTPIKDLPVDLPVKDGRL